MKNKNLLLVLSLGMLFTSCASKTAKQSSSIESSSNETSSENSELVSSISSTTIESSASSENSSNEEQSSSIKKIQVNKEIFKGSFIGSVDWTLLIFSSR